MSKQEVVQRMIERHGVLVNRIRELRLLETTDVVSTALIAVGEMSALYSELDWLTDLIRKVQR
jgi:hypothetical protein